MKQSSQTFQYLGERLFLCFSNLSFTPDIFFISFFIPLAIAAGCTHSLSWGNTGAWGLGTIVSFCHLLFLTLFFSCSFLIMLFLSSNRVFHGLQYLLWHGLSMGHGPFVGCSQLCRAVPENLPCSSSFSASTSLHSHVFTEVPLVSSEEPPSSPAVVPQSDLPAPHRGCPSSCQQLTRHTQGRWAHTFPTPWLSEADFNVLVHRTAESETHSCWNCQELVGCCDRAEMPLSVSILKHLNLHLHLNLLPTLGLLGWKKVLETRVIFISWSQVITVNISIFSKGKHLCWKILVHFLGMFLKESTQQFSQDKVADLSPLLKDRASE